MTWWRDWRMAFGSRGGWWVAMQLPLLVLAALIPLWTGLSPAGLPAWLVPVGWALAGASVVLFVAAASKLGRFLTPFPEPLPQSTLRTGGVYGLVRHPIYTAALGMALGWALVHRSLWGVLFDLLLLVFFDRKAAGEEQRLLAKFPEYAGYRQRVRKLIPWIY